VLHCVVMHCVCISQSRGGLYVYVQHSVERNFLCTAQSKVALCLYCTV